MLVVLMSVASAAITFSDIPTLEQDGTSFNIDVTTDQTETIDFSATSITDGNGKTITFTSSIGNSFNNETLEITINYIVEVGFEFEFGETYSTTLTADGSVSDNDTITLTFEETPFYNGENEGELVISNIDFNTLEGFGDDEDYWYPLDKVEIQFDIDNDGDWDIEDIEIKACLWDEDKEECIFDEDDMNIDDDKFDLDEGDDKTVTMTLEVDPDELTEGNNDYTLYIKAVGNIDDNDAGIYDGDETGDSDSKEIEIRTDDKFVVLGNIEFSETASCGDEIQITADVWNVGDEDQDDVLVIIYNKELGINKKVEIGDIDALEDAKLETIIVLPDNMDEKQYDLILRVYDEDSDIYENDEDDQSEFFAPLTIEEGSCSTVPLVSISASLESNAKAGEELIIKAIVINTGSKTATYSLNVADYADWASLGSIDKTSLTLDAGESAEVLIKLNVKSDVSGDKSFDVELVEGSKILTQPVSITIESKSTTLPSLTGLFAGFGGDNWYLYGIGALNVLLVLIIIIVAVKVSKKKE